MRPFNVLRMVRNAAFVPTPLIDPATKAPTVLYDISDLTTLFQSGTRAAPGPAVAAVGDPVGLVLDKSGNNIDWVQATGGYSPTYQVDAGGGSYLLFDGVDDTLSVAIALTLPFDRITAIRQVAWASPKNIFYASSNAGQLYQSGVSPALKMRTGSATVDVSNSGAAIGANAVTTERHAAAASRLSINNGPYAGPLDIGSTAPTTLRVGASSTNTNAANMRLYALAIKIAGGFDEADIPGINAWIGAKAGLIL